MSAVAKKCRPKGEHAYKIDLSRGQSDHGRKSSLLEPLIICNNCTKRHHLGELGSQLISESAKHILMNISSASNPIGQNITYLKREGCIEFELCQPLKPSNAHLQAMSELVGSEMARREQRLAAHTANDIWEPRQAPPSNWNDPLPERLEAKRQSSFLKQMQEEDSEQSANEALQQKRTGCVIT